MKLDIDKLDFEHCSEEKIHTPESIQSYGYLFALNSKSYKIEIISENVSKLLSSSHIVGETFFDHVAEGDYDKNFIIETFKRAEEQDTRLPIQLEFKKESVSEGRNVFFAVVYKSGTHYVVEIEPAHKFNESYSARQFTKIYATSIAPKFKQIKSLDLMAKEIVATVKNLTGYERVILYRFNEDCSGKVIAEEKEEGMDSYLNLLSPAGDIPEQARELYKKNWIRLTPDTELNNVQLIPSLGQGRNTPLDLSHSLLRSLSPIHLQYVRNQGIRSSMSMSLVTHDKLWGLILCHHRECHYIPQNVRLECENLSQIFSWHLYAKEEELALERLKETDAAISSLLELVGPSQSIVDLLVEHKDRILKLMNADGFIFRSKHTSISFGVVPDEGVIRKVLKSSKGSLSGSLISNRLSETESDSEIKGALITPLTENLNHYTGWFRKEEIKTQKWAGNPDEADPQGSKKERLSPRKSFKVHEKTVYGESREWSVNDINMADRFHKLFLTHALENQVKMKDDIKNLEEQDQSKDEFLATLAHELRNPLSPILSGVELLEAASDEEMKSMVLDTMKRQLSQMTSLVDDLMDVSRITQGKINLRPKACFINDIVSSSLEIAQSLINEKNHQVNLKVKKKDIKVWADPTRLTQVFANIINNAAKYTESGGVIDIEINELNGNVMAKITDNGIGIPEDRLKSIFDMFSQINPHSSNTQGGLGIGLMLVKRLVSLHNGSISASSEGQGQGSTFTLSFPTLEGETIEPEKHKSLNIDILKGKKFLLVDDNKDLAKVYKTLFKTKGMDIKISSRPSHALDMFEEFRPDIAILDIGLPEMNGYELLDALKENEWSQHTIFFSQSGWGTDKHVELSKKHGFRKHLVKPVDSDTLFSILASELS